MGQIQVWDTGSVLPAGAAHTSVIYSPYSINGRILKVEYDDHTVAANGSILLFTSGVPSENIWVAKNLAADAADYPRTNITNNARAALNQASGNVWTEYLTDRPLGLVGSSVGSPASFRLRVFYQQEFP